MSVPRARTSLPPGLRSVAHADHVVTVAGELDPRSAPDATVEQDLHADFLSMRKGSILSCPTSRRAQCQPK